MYCKTSHATAAEKLGEVASALSFGEQVVLAYSCTRDSPQGLQL